MISGDRQNFAIEAQVVEFTKGWLLGHFRFWFYGIPCGDWNDFADLKGCIGWLQKFAGGAANRYEPWMSDCPKERLFNHLLRASFGRGYANIDLGAEAAPLPPIESAYSRFDIAHLGMSAFDGLDMMLVETQELQRCLWYAHKDGTLNEFRFQPRHMQNVAADFCRLFTQEFSEELKVPKT